MTVMVRKFIGCEDRDVRLSAGQTELLENKKQGKK